MRGSRILDRSRKLGLAATAALLTATIASPMVLASPLEPAVVSRSVAPLRELASADACLDQEEVVFLGLINQHRANNGLAPVAVSSSLSAASAYHSIDMAEKGYLDHTLANGTSVQQNMANFGYQGGAYGENIAAGMESGTEAMQIWQNSPDHNANMLNGQFGAIGIGRAYDPNSPNGWYWTTIFGDVSDGPGWLCGEAPPPSKSMSLFQSVGQATSATDLNLRSGPAETFDLVATLPLDTPMTVTGDAQQAYLPVKVDGMYGWVSSEGITNGPVTLQQTAAQPVTASRQPGTATAIGPVEMLSSPAEGAGALDAIPAVAVVTLTGEAQDGFLGVTYNGQTGWADAAWLEVAETSSSATTLLQAAGTTVATQPVAAAPAPQSAALPAAGTPALTTSNVNLRSQPSANSVVLTVLPAGSPVALTGSRANGYVNVRANGQAGWIDETYLQ